MRRIGQRSPVTFCADAFHFEDVIEDSEACLGAELVHDAGKCVFGRSRNGDIFDRSARDTHDMVVMACEPFGKLEPSDSIGSVMLLEHVRVFQERKGSVEGRHRDGCRWAVYELSCSPWT